MKHKTSVAPILCIIVLFFVVRHSLFLGSSVLGTVSSCILYPVLRIQQLVIEPLYGWLDERRSADELSSMYMSLYKDYEEMRAENIVLQSAQNYMRDTQELGVYKRRYYPQSGCIAQVLVRHISDQNNFLLVNTGSGQGIKKDMIAVYKNCLVGKVTDVYPWYCKVCLITDVECKVAAVCAHTGVSGILEGLNSIDHMSLKYVSHLSPVQKGDIILSSGEGLIFPHGLGLGTIQDVCKGDLCYTLIVKPLLDFSAIRYCLLLAKDQLEKADSN